MSIKMIVLASGRGSNFEAIQRSCEQNKIDGEIIAVFSNKAEAKALAKAKDFGIEAHAVVAKEFASQVDYEKALIEQVNAYDYDLIVLAGYMKVLGETFLNEAKSPIMNIHPSLLPSFTGLHAQKQAVDYGVKVSGCTVHFVDAGLDSGPIIAQRVVPVEDDDDEESLSNRILVQEHKLYTEVIAAFAAGRIQVNGRRVTVRD